MLNPNRILAAGVLVSLGAVFAGYLVTLPAVEVAETPPALLPAAYANPAEVAYEDTLRRGETISDLLVRSDLAKEEARELLAKLGEHQDPRRLRAGAVVSYHKSFQSGDLRRLVMRLDADRTLNLLRSGDSWSTTVEEVPVFTDTVVLAGEVRSSLYRALLDIEGTDVPAEERKAVADVLADRIFAWQIDFSRDLRKGDEFRVLYERMVRPDGTARTSRVLAVQFEMNGRQREAYLFRASSGVEDYYDRDGESLRRAFLRAPLEFRRISSAFNRSRFHPVLKVSRPHNGIDYAAAAGTPVRAVGDGTVARAGWAGGYGNLVEIRHQRGYSSRYAHLQRFATGVRPGSRVRQGDLIGYVGATGLATGPHLHYEFHENGRPVDPNNVRFISGEPVARQHRDQFRASVNAQVAAISRATEVHYAAGRGVESTSGSE
jgi:murein DD-endopeptidase MepM/ murein hydrolase activator NlpD